LNSPRSWQPPDVSKHHHSIHFRRSCQERKPHWRQHLSIFNGSGRGPRDTHPAFAPGWVTEGLADYVRWYLYEPQSKGTIIRDASQAKYDASYRVTANFFDWVVTTHDKDLLRKLNTAGREASYSEEL